MTALVVHAHEHIAVLAHGDRVLASATVTPYGWHISKGYSHPPSRPTLPRRREWEPLPTKAEAVAALHQIRLQLRARFQARRIT